MLSKRGKRVRSMLSRLRQRGGATDPDVDTGTPSSGTSQQHGTEAPSSGTSQQHGPAATFSGTGSNVQSSPAFTPGKDIK